MEDFGPLMEKQAFDLRDICYVTKAFVRLGIGNEEFYQ